MLQEGNLIITDMFIGNTDIFSKICIILLNNGVN
jgi:hypothetical protein